MTPKRKKHLELALRRAKEIIGKAPPEGMNANILKLRMTAWRANGPRLWLLDNLRKQGFDWEVTDLTKRGDPIIWIKKQTDYSEAPITEINSSSCAI